MRKKILLVMPMVHEDGRKVLAKEMDLIDAREPSPDVYVDQVADVNAIYLYGPSYITRDIMLKARRLLVIAGGGAGIEYIDQQAATELDIAVVHAPGLGANPVAEHTIGMMICLAKQIPLAERLLREKGNYEARFKLKTHELEGKTVGIIGLGHIGSEVARKCRVGFNMRVLAYDPVVEAEKASRLGVELCVSLKQLLMEADFVSTHVPLVPETRHLIGQKELNLMKKTAYLINTSRGGVVDESALVNALRSGQIAGAGIDVFEQEPPDSSNPLFQMDNVVVTPHYAGITEETLQRLSVAVAEQILMALRGERPQYLANPECWERFKRRLSQFP